MSNALHSLYLTLMGIHLLGLISPGPDFTLVSRNALIFGRGKGIQTAFGIALGIFIHLGYVLFGLGIILKKVPAVFNVIQFFGACYLLFLGYNSIRSVLNQRISIDTKNFSSTELKRGHFIQQGFMTNILNAKAALYFLSIFSRFFDPKTPISFQLWVGFGIVLLTFLWFSFIAWLFSLKVVGGAVKSHLKKVDFFFGLVLGALGIELIYELILKF